MAYSMHRQRHSEADVRIPSRMPIRIHQIEAVTVPEGRNPRQERASSDEERDGDLDDAKQGREAPDVQGAAAAPADS